MCVVQLVFCSILTHAEIHQAGILTEVHREITGSKAVHSDHQTPDMLEVSQIVIGYKEDCALKC